VQHDPTNASFDNPAPFDNVEAANSWVSVGDFDVDSEAGAVFDDGVLEAGVDPAVSVPWLVRGTLVEVITLWVSITETVGWGLRPSFTRARPVRS
jgi:hypothetical protein